MKLLKAANSREMRWSNGQGVTFEIALHPPGAAFPQDFEWRLSSARVQTRASFSLFQGCRRWLTVLEGEGLSLNGQSLLQRELIEFSGETPIEAVPLKGPVVDLGLIYRPDRVHVDVRWLKPGENNFGVGLHLIFCDGNRSNVGEIRLEKYDTLQFAGPERVTITDEILAFSITSL